MATGTIILPIQCAKLPATASAALDGSELNYRALYDATTDESLFWQFRMPADYASGLTAKIQFSMNSTQAATRYIEWEVLVMAVTPGDAADIVTDSYDTTNAANKDVSSLTAGYLVELSISLSNVDSLAAGDYIKIKLTRDANGTNGTDSATGDAEVVAFSLEYTTS